MIKTTDVSRSKWSYIDNHQNTRQFIREACYGGRVGTNIQEINSSRCSEILRNHLRSCSEGICNLRQEVTKWIDVSNEDYRKKFYEIK